MNIDECIAKGLLKRDKPDIEKAKKSIETAKYKLEIAKREFDAGIYEGAIISAYNAMFHAARALLYKDGFKERSHYALFIYISEKYGDKLEKRFIHELETLRIERHEMRFQLQMILSMQ